MKETLVKILAWGIGLLTLVVIIFILTDNLYDETSLKIASSLGIILFFCIPGLLCARVEDKYPKICNIGVIASLAACVAALLFIWEVITFNYNNMEFIAKIFSIVIIAAFSLGHISILLACDSVRSSVGTVKAITISLSVFLDLIFIYSILIEPVDIGGKFLAILYLLVTSGTILTPLLNRISEDS